MTGDHGRQVLALPPASRGLWLLLLLQVAACATAVHGTSASSDAPLAASTLVPLEAAAASYTAGADARPPVDPLAIRLKAELDRLTKQLGRPRLVEDARFDRVAKDIARVREQEHAAAANAITFLLAHYGVVEPEPNLILMAGGPGSEDAAIADLGKQFSQIPAAATWNRVGIGVWREGQSWTAVLALQEHNLSLDPLPRALPSGGHVRVSGRLVGPYQSPQVLMTSPGGEVHTLPTQVQGKAFKAELQCALGDGPYQVEVTADDRRGPTVLANFPVFCGVAPPATLRIVAEAQASISDPGEIEKQILDRVDRDRAANGLPALVRDARLARVARAYSKEMAESGEVGHLSQRSGNAVDRVRAAGISPMPTTVAENVGRGYSAAEAERGFMSSPGHRENILSRRVTHIGVGVAIGKREGEATPIFVTQVFAGWGQ